MTTLIGERTDRWAGVARSTGGVGLMTVVLMFGTIIAVSTVGEPPFTASAEQARAFFVGSGQGWAQTVSTLTALCAVGFVVFFTGTGLLLARAEGDPPWRAAVAAVSGLALPGYLLLNPAWGAAAYGAADLDPAVASYAFDIGNLGFANVWLAMGCCAISCGWVLLATRLTGRVLGWWAIVSGLGLMAARFVWTTGAWYLPYFAFWIWVIVLCIRLIRRPLPGRP